MFFKIMPLENRFLDFFFKSEIIVFLFPSSGRLHSYLRMRNGSYKKIPHFWNIFTFVDFIYILISSGFLKIEIKNFNSDPCFCSLVKLSAISPAVHILNCVVGRSQIKVAVIRALSKFLLV